MIGQYEVYKQMYEAESTHWWYRSLHRLILRQFNRQQVSKEAKIVDLACGTGGLMQQLESFSFKNIEGLDIDENAINFCKERGLKVQQSPLENMDQLFSKNSVDVLLCNDALYFPERTELVGIFKKASTILKTGGLLFFNIPIRKSLRGPHDAVVGIRERFHPNEIFSYLDQNQFKLVSKRQWPSFLGLLIYIIRAWRRMIGVKAESDLSMPSVGLNNVFYSINQLEQSFGLSNFYGSSLFVCLRKL